MDAKGYNDLTPLIFACFRGHLPIVEYLISKGADIEAKDKSGNSLIHFSSTRFLSIVQYLIEKRNIDKDIKGYEERAPLHHACNGGHLQIVEYLISKGANIEAKDKNKKTPLHYACYKGHLQIVEYLISKGANIKAKDSSENTPLHYASKMSQTDVVKYLLSNGAN